MEALFCRGEIGIIRIAKVLVEQIRSFVRRRINNSGGRESMLAARRVHLGGEPSKSIIFEGSRDPNNPSIPYVTRS